MSSVSRDIIIFDKMDLLEVRSSITPSLEELRLLSIEYWTHKNGFIEIVGRTEE